MFNQRSMGDQTKLPFINVENSLFVTNENSLKCVIRSVTCPLFYNTFGNIIF